MTRDVGLLAAVDTARRVDEAAQEAAARAREALRAAAVEAVLDGWPGTEVAERSGVKRQTIWLWSQDYDWDGYSRRRGGGSWPS